MRGISLKTRLNILFSSAIMIPVLLVFFKMLFIFNDSYQRDSGSDAVLLYVNMFKYEITALLLLTAILGVIFVYINKEILNPLMILNESVWEIKNGREPQRLGLLKKGEFSEIALTIEEMFLSIGKYKNDIEIQSDEILNKSNRLREANIKLEALCGHMQIIIEEMEDEQKKNSRLENKIPEINCIIDYFGVICGVENVCTELLGYERQDLVGLHFIELFKTDKDKVSLQSVISMLEAQETVIIEAFLCKKDEKLFQAEIHFSKYISGGIQAGFQMTIKGMATMPKETEGTLDNDFALLNSVSKSLTGKRNLTELSRFIVDEVATKFQIPICILGIVDEHSYNIKVKACAGSYIGDSEDGKALTNRINLNKVLAERSMISSESIDKNNLSDNWAICKINEGFPDKEKIRELLYVPVCAKAKKVGVLVVGFKEEIKQKDINLINSIANNIAIAIDNALLHELSTKYFVKTVNSLIAAIEAKDKYTKGHSQRVSKYSEYIGAKLELPSEQIEDLKIASVLHDIGKIGINDQILTKPGKLTKDEYKEIRQHPTISNKILSHIGFSDRSMKAIAFHHERYDGKGYPFGLSGNQISIDAQIIAVADAYDAMTSNRPYRNAMSANDAMKELSINRNTQFNARVVDTVINNKESFQKEFGFKV